MERHFVLTTRFREGCPIHRTARMTVVTDNRLGFSRQASLSEVMNTPSPSIPANLVNGKPCRRGQQAVYLPSASRFPPEKVSKADAPLSQDYKPPPLGSKLCPIFFSHLRPLPTQFPITKQRANQMTAAQKATPVSRSAHQCADMLNHRIAISKPWTGVLRQCLASNNDVWHLRPSGFRQSSLMSLSMHSCGLDQLSRCILSTSLILNVALSTWRSQRPTLNNTTVDTREHSMCQPWTVQHQKIGWASMIQDWASRLTGGFLQA